MVIIDQAVAFIGGIDLAFGRYDTQNHSVGDVNTDHFPGKDFYNPRLAPFGHLDNPYQDPGSRLTICLPCTAIALIPR